jgi:hypothetical protein
MYCPSCGSVLTQQMKFCNRCGSQLTTTKDKIELVKVFEKQMDKAMEGLFWVTILGLGVIFGGSAILKKVQLSQWMIVAYMILSTAAFLSYFVLSVWQVRRLARNAEQANSVIPIDQPNTAELDPAKDFPVIEGVISVTENTTRTLEAVPVPNKSRGPAPR